MSLPRITIIGGGPGGLTLARLLHLHRIPIKVYESDPSRTARNQGGSLDLHHKTGLAAIRAMKVTSEFRAKARPEGEHMFVYSTDGEVLLDFGRSEDVEDGVENEKERPEIDRMELRGPLLDSLPDGTVQWGKRIVSVAPTPAAEPGVHTQSRSRMGRLWNRIWWWERMGVGLKSDLS
ncbi:hypothetical protein HDV00_010064 [Rhizophlyctis rosea]|nr:hypothetical protein HDV00_010064 [Rhizophlyctis rosea]